MIGQLLTVWQRLTPYACICFLCIATSDRTISGRSRPDWSWLHWASRSSFTGHFRTAPGGHRLLDKAVDLPNVHIHHHQSTTIRSKSWQAIHFTVPSVEGRGLRVRWLGTCWDGTRVFVLTSPAAYSTSADRRQLSPVVDTRRVLCAD